MEIPVKQRTPEWFSVRASCQLTASRFGDAIGVGKGKPYDFFRYCLSQDEDGEDTDNTHLQHGIDMEDIISQAYQLLTKNLLRESGPWVPTDGRLKNLIAASPDGIVMSENYGKAKGLVEFKAPVYKMYKGDDLIQGIPRHYMAQVQGQLAVCNMKWCDFMAVCVATKEILLKRVYFEHFYWLQVSSKLEQFCTVLKEAKHCVENGDDPFDLESVKHLKSLQIQEALLPGEASITVKNLLEVKDDKFKGPSQEWYTFDSLIGRHQTEHDTLEPFYEELFDDCDLDMQITNTKS